MSRSNNLLRFAWRSSRSNFRVTSSHPRHGIGMVNRREMSTSVGVLFPENVAHATTGTWTHVVENQPPALQNTNLFESDVALKKYVTEDGGAGWASDHLSQFGERCGSSEVIEWGHAANKNPPVFHSHDRYGHRIDVVDFHPSYHNLMSLAMEYGVHSFPWEEANKGEAGAHVARAALLYLLSQAEAGVGCPMSMTYAGIPVLSQQTDIAAEWMPKLTSRTYDPQNRPISEKAGATIGMAMTEKQGGSDVKKNTTMANPLSAATGPGAYYELVGHKWFCSAPMCDAFLTLAQTRSVSGESDGSPSCFFVPRWRDEEGKRNKGFKVQRLKDKLGNKSNASSEIEYESTRAIMIGPEGKGIKTIIEMVSHTRLDCTIGSAALMRTATAQAIHHVTHRRAFGKRLLEQPLMMNVVADLAIESEAATRLMCRMAATFDNPKEKLLGRLMLAVGKYWVCKRVVPVVAEGMECLGGNGYTEDFPLARAYREAPLNGIWEGSGNVMCLDVLRAMGTEKESVQAFMSELVRSKGVDKRFDEYLTSLEKELENQEDLQYRARYLVEKMAICLQAALLLRSDSPDVAEVFCSSRLSTDSRGYQLGTLPVLPTETLMSIIDRAAPHN